MALQPPVIGIGETGPTVYEEIYRQPERLLLGVLAFFALLMGGGFAFRKFSDDHPVAALSFDGDGVGRFVRL